LDAAREAMAVPAFRDALRALDPPLSHALEHAGLARPGASEIAEGRLALLAIIITLFTAEIAKGRLA
jgi:hypothetical protein